MKNKKTFLLALSLAIFLNGLFFLMPTEARANYAAVLSNGGVKYDVPIYYDNNDCNAVFRSGSFNIGVYGNLPVYGYAINPNSGAGIEKLIYQAPSSWNVIASPAARFENISVIGGVSSNSFSGSRPLYGFTVGESGDPDVDWGSDDWALVPGQCGVGGWMLSPSSLFGYVATSPSVYTCPSGGTLSGTTCITDNGCAANTCNTTQCWNNLAWVQGTRVCANNSCAANTCTTSVCWNNLTWISGTKVCADNSCAASTCSTSSCWNNLTWIAGTKNCDNGCAASTCTTGTCFNGMATVTGTKTTDECSAPTGFSSTCNADGNTLSLNWNPTSGATGYHLRTDDTTDGYWYNPATDTYADNYSGTSYSRSVTPGVTYNSWIHSVGPAGYSSASSLSAVCTSNCAASICNNTSCWNGLTWVPGTLVCADNSCAANTCTTATCWNNLAWISGTKNPTYSNLGCTYSNSVDCSKPENCGQSNTATPSSCFGTNSCTGSTDNLPLANCSSVCAVSTQSCAGCPLQVNEWQEVAL